ncbi:helix-turn-helix transcriptional regulator [Corynebacterium freiburgense]|uniref:helix-turn-helix transcriptional regulator n=1 Tax=Corynebacterium freiburgense TaxID=556548 RepID=UPI0012EB7EBC|nr:transcriptional regulator [Corynebacterium freiburgense]
MPTDFSSPSPAARLATDTLPLSRMQRLVLETIRGFEHGAKASDIAAKLGMHINTVRGHLDELSDLQAIVTEREKTHGRGRPSVIFHARIPSGSEVLSEHAALVHALVDHLGDPHDPKVQETATDIGREWARKIERSGKTWSTPEEAAKALTRALRQLGFDPGTRFTRNECTVIDVHACPFITSDHRPPNPLICAIHEGFLHEALGPYGQGIAHIQLLPMAKPNCCQVLLETQKDQD